MGHESCHNIYSLDYSLTIFKLKRPFGAFIVYVLCLIALNVCISDLIVYVSQCDFVYWYPHMQYKSTNNTFYVQLIVSALMEMNRLVFVIFKHFMYFLFNKTNHKLSIKSRPSHIFFAYEVQFK